MENTQAKKHNNNHETVNGELTIPVVILRFAVENRKFSQVQVYLAAKMLFSNKFFGNDVKTLAEALGRCEKTIKTHLDWLVENRWLGEDRNRGIYFVRSWNYMRNSLNDRTRSGVHFQSFDIRCFKAFAIAVAYDLLIARQEYRRWQKTHRESREKGSSVQIGVSGAFGLYPVSNEAFAKIFNVSIPTASRYRTLAAKEGFIKLREQLIAINIDPKDKAARFILREDVDAPIPIVFRNDRYFEQKTSLVRSNVIRKRISSLKRGKK